MERSKRLVRAKSDRLSSLPDAVLCHILSFLPTKLSVATSILATRWRFLWADVLNLDFDSAKHKQKYEMSFADGKMSFADTINRVMLLRNVQDINTFRLIIKKNTFIDDVRSLDTWIRNTIARNVQALDIHLFHQDGLTLPPCLFTCQTLVDLRLHFCGCVPDAVFLPNLKKLRLDSFRYEGDEKLQDLISGCPVLEELKIDTIIEHDLKSCVISSPTIKWLTLNLYISEPRESDFWDYELVINTPEVRYLNVDNHIAQHISTGTFNSLVEANICLCNDEVKDNVAYSSSVLELVDKLCQVKRLRLSSCYTQFLDATFATATSRFINLTKLELAADWIFLLKFLESADNLQVLIIGEVYDVKYWTEPQHVPMCLSSHLRQVTIDSFGYSEDEFKTVSYFLRNGKVLNMMDITSQEEGEIESVLEAKFDALRRISEFERQSVTFLLKYCDE
ncbi:hypothetical protein BUALT_Bualt16G0004300 [Buddleja alternifolia]|uniref:F-box domain-containing protein n=1 Tax=Buddleja alternifolia TaxID=168488 RepID=A0AAV6W9P4_9LAMI|nr:hypothetical protein BUALT_Bualt16G0004300 [Buddleja alternifolia]